MTIDNPTSAAAPPESGVRLRARNAALAELRKAPVARSWRWDMAGTLLVVLGTTAVVIGIGAWLSIVEMDRVRERILALGLLLALQALGIVAAITPGRAVLRVAVALLAVGATVAILVGRGGGLASATPAVACSASHLAVDLIPLGLVLVSLRRFSWTLGRSLLAGAAVAATGAIAGELSCGRDWTHALVHHVGAGVVIAVVCALVSRAPTTRNVRALNRTSTHMDHRPNIGAIGLRVRRLIGLVALVVAVVLALVFGFRAWTAWRLVVFFPLAVAAASWLEVRRRTCVLRAIAGTVEGEDGSINPAPACDVSPSRRLARGIVRDAVLLGAVGTALVTLV